jgi:hypothetical protein
MQTQNPLEGTENAVFGTVKAVLKAMPAKGLEPPTPGLQNQCRGDVSGLNDKYLQNTQSEMGLNCGFSAQKNMQEPAEIDPDLQVIIDRWQSLPDHIRETIKTLAGIEVKP